MEFWILAMLAAVAAFWYSGMRARETAVHLAARACRRDGLQLLDETVALVRLRPARDGMGRFAWRRTYAFEFSLGQDRRRGWLELVGGRLAALDLEMPDHLLHEGVVDEED